MKNEQIFYYYGGKQRYDSLDKDDKNRYLSWREAQMMLVQKTLLDLGLKINISKSVLIPSRELEYLGIWLDCLHLRVTVTRKKRDLIC